MKAKYTFIVIAVLTGITALYEALIMHSVVKTVIWVCITIVWASVAVLWKDRK
ncbi:hypothetical protein ACFQY8_07580 [Alloscardovia venturai]|uniref:Uncharacterized protein n=1 Tax=Alloscardovia venturai TaxID=1769421 RepID=A0ABW2Y744_9BIFI